MKATELLMQLDIKNEHELRKMLADMLNQVMTINYARKEMPVGESITGTYLIKVEKLYSTGDHTMKQCCELAAEDLSPIIDKFFNAMEVDQ